MADTLTPFQSVGSEGVSNLASKLLLALLPPNIPFIRLSAYNIPDSYASKAETAFAKVEREVQQSAAILRPVAYELMKHLLIVGNALLVYESTSDKFYCVDLHHYVCRRSITGKLLELIISYQLYSDQLSQDEVSHLSRLGAIKEGELENKLFCYTRITYDANDDKYSEIKEVNGIQLPDTHIRYDQDEFPYIALRYNVISGSSYGTGLIDEVIGDLKTLENLNWAISFSASAMSKLVFLVNPHGVTRVRDLAQCDSGDFVSGRPEDVACLQANKQADLSVALQQAATIEQRLKASFLMFQAMTRQAERVTAEEVRRIAEEIESGRAGTYSLLTEEFQLPLAKLLLSILYRKKVVPKVPSTINLVITTGMDALGRTQDLARYTTFLNSIAPLGEAAMPLLDVKKYVAAIATALGIDQEEILKSDETLQAEQDARDSREANSMASRELMRGAASAIANTSQSRT